MLLALLAAQHWHVPMYLDAFRAVGADIQLGFFPEGELDWWSLSPELNRVKYLISA